MQSLNVLDEYFQKIAPLKLAESWDNVGWLIKSSKIIPLPAKVMLTNDITAEVMDEAIREEVNVIMAYHPRIFRGLKRLVPEDPTGNIVIQCIQNNISVFCGHTCFDSVQNGVNDWLISGLGEAESVEVVQPNLDNPGCGIGRILKLKEECCLEDMIGRIKIHLKLPHVRLALAEGISTAKDTKISSVAVCAGSGASVLGGVNADLYLTGEMGHHEVLAANAGGANVILCEHSNTERGFLTVLCERMEKAEELVGKVDVIVSTVDKDPLVVV
eukprot:TRINITY_DN779850_c0_g1_i1.p1 TRINITY_DN779850_c0_g1~~TRINITY_DN779850_c0_g1_i1.p1  ORF type:complete len:272 (+),score=76.15 TRINITY_DN779850_c0_g1_i1:91-906(+)